MPAAPIWTDPNAFHGNLTVKQLASGWRVRCSIAPLARRYYDPVSERMACGPQELQQIAYILDSGLSVDGTRHRATWSIQTELRTRQVAAD
jgi:hypothetical protein